jgi:hypothetical protein
MKAKKYFILLAVIAGILYSSVWGEQRQIEEDYRAVLIGRSHPTLAGIEGLAVVIVPPDAEPNKESLVWIWTELNTKVIERLSKDGIKIIPGVAGNILNIVELRIDIDMLELADSQQSVFYVQTSLSRAVCLTEEQRFSFKADVWDTEPVMLAVSAEKMSEKVTSVALEQVEAFIHSYLAANTPSKRPSEQKNISIVPKEQLEPVDKSTPAKYIFVSSKNSKVFHIPDCTSAKRIKPENLITYNSKDEAVNAGKRPCKICKP